MATSSFRFSLLEEKVDDISITKKKFSSSIMYLPIFIFYVQCY